MHMDFWCLLLRLCALSASVNICMCVFVHVCEDFSINVYESMTNATNASIDSYRHELSINVYEFIMSIVIIINSYALTVALSVSVYICMCEFVHVCEVFPINVYEFIMSIAVDCCLCCVGHKFIYIDRRHFTHMHKHTHTYIHTHRKCYYQCI